MNKKKLADVVNFAKSRGYKISLRNIESYLKTKGENNDQVLSKLLDSFAANREDVPLQLSIPVAGLYRKKALESLHSPDDLNTLLKLTTPLSWVVLSILVLITVLLILWGVFGSIPVHVHGLGSIQNQGGAIYSVVAKSAGRIEILYVQSNQQVKKGDKLISLTLPEKETELAGVLRNLEISRHRYQTAKEASIQLIADYNRNTKAANAALKKNLTSLNQQSGYLSSLLSRQQEELKSGYVVFTQVETTRSELYSIEKAIRDNRNQIDLNLTSLAEFETTQIQSTASMKQQVVKLEENLKLIETALDTSGLIHSPFDGTVTELDTRPGNWVLADQALVTIEQQGPELLLYAYFITGTGKKLTAGMRADVAPTSVQQSLYGSIIGKVESVGDLAESREGLMAIFGNEDLVNSLLSEGAPIQAIISLQKDPTTYSGFKWSSSRGPEFKITAGNMASVAVRVREKKPIEFIIPIFKAWEPGA